MTVSEGAAIIEGRLLEWVHADSCFSANVVSLRAARKLSPDPVFNLAAFMKYSYGSTLSNLSDSDWIEEAQQAQKILRTL
jgi:hypothetical protein